MSSNRFELRNFSYCFCNAWLCEVYRNNSRNVSQSFANHIASLLFYLAGCLQMETANVVEIADLECVRLGPHTIEPREVRRRDYGD